MNVSFDEDGNGYFLNAEQVRKSVFRIAQPEWMSLSISYGSPPTGYSYVLRLLKTFDWETWFWESFEQNGYYQIDLTSGETTFLGQNIDLILITLPTLNYKTFNDSVDGIWDRHVDRWGIDGKIDRHSRRSL